MENIVKNLLTNDILNNNLRIDLDTLYEKELNKIDVYSDIYWTAKNEKDYKFIENEIFNYKIDNDLFSIVCWCDVSGFDYWVIKQEETNYVSIDVYLKKDAILYSEAELEEIKKAIINTNNFFDRLIN